MATMSSKQSHVVVLFSAQAAFATLSQGPTPLPAFASSMCCAAYAADEIIRVDSFTDYFTTPFVPTIEHQY
jgi:hypothetical protein